jgi:hypothetical protein
MRRTVRCALVLALAGAFAAPVAAQDDASREARLLAEDGKFREADGVINRASAEVQNDLELRLWVGGKALKFAEGLAGEAQRDPLFIAKQQFVKSLELKPDDPRSGTGLLAACKELADLEMAGKKVEEARVEAKFALENAEKALAAGVATQEFKLALGRMHAFRASLTKSMKDVELLASDSAKAAKLLAEGSAGNEKAGAILAEASAVRLRVASLIHEGIPVDGEKRDDEAMASALDLAKQACAIPNANENDFRAHFDVLRLMHRWGMKSKEKPFMQAVAPGVGELKLQVPKARGWTRLKTDQYDVAYVRDLKDPADTNIVQVFLKLWKPSETMLGGKWSDLKDMAERRHEKYAKEDMTDLQKDVAPVELGGAAKNAPEIWHYEALGTQKGEKPHVVWISEFIFQPDKKKEDRFQLKLVDWRQAPDLLEPDIAAFVDSAIGEGRWPPEKGKGGDTKKPPKKK